MRASTRLKFVFICNPKCASTSVRDALDPFSNVRANPRSPNMPISNHARASAVKAIFESKGRDWSEYFCFTTVRNPWAKVASLWSYGKRQPRSVWHDAASQADTIADFVATPTFAERARTLDYMTRDDDGKMLVDGIYKVEDLNESLPEINERLGFEIDIPHLNTTKQLRYREVFDSNSVDKISELFKSDIEFGKYEF